MKVSRLELIQKLIRKEYKNKRPNAIQQMELIHRYNLQLHKSDGKKRSREALTKAVAIAVKSL